MTSIYKSKDICRKTGCSHRQLQYWEQKKYLSPKLGSRNIRYYSDEDILIIKNIIELKRKGKSLGEAFSQSTLVQSKEPISNLMGDKISTNQLLESDWLKKNAELIHLLDEIQTLENSIPRFPYFVYNKDNVQTLKNLQEQAVRIKKQKDAIITRLQSSFVKQTQSNLANSITPELDSSKKIESTYTIDQLVIMWIKKNKETNASFIREKISKRIATGESTDSIAIELRDYPAESKDDGGGSFTF